MHFRRPGRIIIIVRSEEGGAWPKWGISYEGRGYEIMMMWSSYSLHCQRGNHPIHTRLRATVVAVPFERALESETPFRVLGAISHALRSSPALSGLVLPE